MSTMKIAQPAKKTTPSRLQSIIARRSLVAFFILALIAMLAPLAQLARVQAAPPSMTGPSMDTLMGTIDAYVEQERQAAQVPGIALGIVQGNRVVHMQGFGVADPSGRPVTPETTFHIGSTAKSMTAVAIMQLVEQGRVDLNAPIQRYLPWFTLADPAAAKRITVRHLLTHTSGLSRQMGLDVAMNRADTSDGALERQVRAWNSAETTTAPGTTFQYNNANYVILGLLVETLSGQSFERYLHQHIFTPLEMHDATLGAIVGAKQPLAAGYRYWFGVPRAADIAYGRVINPAGGVIASVEDMTHYLLAQLNGGRYRDTQLLTTSSIAEVQRPAITIPPDAPQAGGFDEVAYGFGWMAGKRDGISVVAHPGDLPSFHADMLLVPDKQLGIVLLMNANDRLTGERMRRIGDGVTSLMLGREPVPVETGDSVGLLIFRIVLGLALLQVVVIGWSVRTIRRWIRNTTARPHGVLPLIWHVFVPLGFHLLLALCFLLGLPRVFNLPLALLVESTPDIGMVAIASGIIALGWSILRTAIAYYILRGRRAAALPGATRVAA